MRNGLARRTPFWAFSAGLIQQDMDPVTRRFNYECDTLYATNSALGLDFLRDNMANDITEVVKR